MKPKPFLYILNEPHDDIEGKFQVGNRWYIQLGCLDDVEDFVNKYGYGRFINTNTLYYITKTSIRGDEEISPHEKAFKIGDENNWFIRISDLASFIKETGKSIVDFPDDDFPFIEIYDDYRE